MNSSAAGLIAAGLLAFEGQAEPGRSRAEVIQLGAETVVLSEDEVAVRDRAAGWRVELSPLGESRDRGGARRATTPMVPHPVLRVAGTEASALSRRIVTGQLSVRLRGEELTAMDAATVAGKLAEAHGLVDDGVAEGAAPWRLFRADPPARALEIIALLRADPRVAEAEVVVARQMARRALPNDPLLPYQWNLKNLVPTADGGPPADLGVEAVWGGFEQGGAGWRGRGVRLGIIDDGIDYTHPEFADGRLDVAAGRNWNGGASGNGAAQAPADTHGTAVAGLAAAAADNALGVAGVAPAAGLVSLRLTASAHDDAEEAQALSYLANPRPGGGLAEVIHVKNASWGPLDGAFRLAGPGPLARQALATAAREGRGGRGTVFVWAVGNGGAFGEDANADGYANNPHVIAVGAMDSNGRVPSYSESGACVAVVAPTGVDDGVPLLTTDRPGRAGFNPPRTGTDLDDQAFTFGFGGTSAAAPQVAGVCALMLEANPALGWRDVKEILLRSARRVQPRSPAWFSNAVGLRFHPLQGAGLVDAAAATTMAAAWTPLGPAIELRANAMQPGAIPDTPESGLTRTFTIGPQRRVEQALVRFSANHPYRGDLKITLTSPGGTTSVLAPSYFAASPAGQANYDQWVFTSLHFWGENSQGSWTLRVVDVLPEETGRFLGADLTLLAAEALPDPVFTSTAARTAAVGAAFLHTVTATHGPVAFTTVGPLPPGLEFDATTGTLRGRPSRAGAYAIEFRGSTASGSVTQAFQLTVVGLYDAWAVAQELPASEAGPADDPDRDGWPNVLEYAANAQPLDPITPEILQCRAGVDRAPTIDFRRWPARSDASWQVEHSPDAEEWTIVAESRHGLPAISLVADRFTVGETTHTDGSVTVTITDGAAPAPPHAWFRLRALLEP